MSLESRCRVDGVLAEKHHLRDRAAADGHETVCDMNTFTIQTSIDAILQARLALDHDGRPCLRHSTPASWDRPLPIRCQPHEPYQENIAETTPFTSPDFLLSIPDGLVLKQHRSPLCMDCRTREIFCHPAMDGAFVRDENTWRSVFCNLNASHSVRLEGSCLLLDSRFGKEFYHFYVSVIGRMASYLSFDRYLDRVNYFILPEPVAHVIAWADLLGIPQSKRVFLAEQTAVHADELLVPHHIDHIDYRTIAFLRNHLLNHAQGTRQHARNRIYISRSRSANGRHILNEEDVVARVLRPRGFEVVCFEAMSLGEQAACMANAECVIAAHGAGLTNLVFCQPGTRVLEIFTPKWIVFCFARLGSMLGLQCYYHVGEAAHGKDVTLQVDVFENVVDEFLGRG